MILRLRNVLLGIVGAGGIVVCSPIAYRGYCTRYYTGSELLTDKVVVITGASDGVGAAAAKEFAKKGARVIMACRDLAECKKRRRDIVLATRNKDVRCRTLDLGSTESISKFAEKIIQTEKSVDILVNSASTWRIKRILTRDGFEENLGVNFLGHFLLTNLLLDKLSSSASGRILNVSCFDYKRGTLDFDDLNYDKRKFDGYEAYKASKLAMVLFSLELEQRLKGTRVAVNIIDPDKCNTKLVKEGHKRKLLTFAANMFAKAFYFNTTQGVQSYLHGALAPETGNTSGGYYRNSKFEPIPEEISQDRKLALRLWLTAEKWTRLHANKAVAMSTEPQKSEATKSKTFYFF